MIRNKLLRLNCPLLLHRLFSQLIPKRTKSAIIGVQASANQMGYMAIKQFQSILTNQSYSEIKSSQIYQRKYSKQPPASIHQHDIFANRDYHPRYLASFKIQSDQDQPHALNQMIKHISMNINSQFSDYSVGGNNQRRHHSRDMIKQFEYMQQQKREIKEKSVRWRVEEYYDKFKPQFPLNLTSHLLLYQNVVGEIDDLQLPSDHLVKKNGYLRPVLDLDRQLVHPISNQKLNDILKSDSQELELNDNQRLERVIKIKSNRQSFSQSCRSNDSQIILRKSDRAIRLQNIDIDFLQQYKGIGKLQSKHQFYYDKRFKELAMSVIGLMRRQYAINQVQIFKLNLMKQNDGKQRREYVDYQFYHYDELLDMYQRFFDELERAPNNFRMSNAIICLEITRGDVLKALLSKGYKIDMVCDESGGHFDDQVMKVTGALNFPLMLPYQPIAVNARQFTGSHFKARNASDEVDDTEKAIKYFNRVLRTAKRNGNFEQDVIIDLSSAKSQHLSNLSVQRFQQRFSNPIVCKMDDKQIESVEFKQIQNCTPNLK